MGLLDNIKGYFNAFEDEELEEEIVEQVEDKTEAKKVIRQEEPRRQETPRIVGGRNKTVNFNTQMQVVLVKPERYEDVTSIADHLNDKKTVVLNQPLKKWL